MDRFIKFNPTDEAMYLLTHKTNAFKLLTIIAERARRESGHPDGLLPGECFLGDWNACGFTEKEYRTAKDILVKRKHIEIVETCRTRKKSATGTATVGTKVKLISLSVYDINAETKGDRKGDRGATEGRPKGDEQERIRKNNKEEENTHTPQRMVVGGELEIECEIIPFSIQSSLEMPVTNQIAPKLSNHSSTQNRPTQTVLTPSYSKTKSKGDPNFYQTFGKANLVRLNQEQFDVLKNDMKMGNVEFDYWIEQVELAIEKNSRSFNAQYSNHLSAIKSFKSFRESQKNFNPPYMKVEKLEVEKAIEKENRDYAEGADQNLKSNTSKINVFENTVEVVSGQKCVHFEYKDKDFKKKFDHELFRCGFYLKNSKPLNLAELVK